MDIWIISGFWLLQIKTALRTRVQVFAWTYAFFSYVNIGVEWLNHMVLVHKCLLSYNSSNLHLFIGLFAINTSSLVKCPNLLPIYLHICN